VKALLSGAVGAAPPSPAERPTPARLLSRVLMASFVEAGAKMIWLHGERIPEAVTSRFTDALAHCLLPRLRRSSELRPPVQSVRDPARDVAAALNEGPYQFCIRKLSRVLPRNRSASWSATILGNPSGQISTVAVRLVLEAPTAADASEEREIAGRYQAQLH